MNSNHYLPVFAAALLAATLLAPSCKKVDPEIEAMPELPAAAFTLSAVETRGTEVEFPWTISKDGRTDSVKESIDEMYVTAANDLVLYVKGTGAGYGGVNVRSTNKDAVKVEALGKSTDGADAYALVYLADGEADIEVWNGSRSGTAGQMTTFHVHSVFSIPPTAVVFGLEIHDLRDGTEKISHKEIFCDKFFTTGYYSGSDFYNYCWAVWGSGVDRERYHIWIEGQGIVYDADNEVLYCAYTANVTFDRIEPENCSYREFNFNTDKYWEFAKVQADGALFRYYDRIGKTYVWDNYSGDYADCKRNMWAPSVISVMPWSIMSLISKKAGVTYGTALLNGYEPRYYE